MALISWVNMVDFATLGATSAVPGMPVTNLQTTIINDVWRTEGGTASIDVDFQKPVPLDVLAFAQPNDGPKMAPTDALSHHLSLISRGGEEVYASGGIPTDIDPRTGYHFHKLPSQMMARYWRLSLDGFSLRQAHIFYIDIGRLWAGQSWQPTYNFTYGWSRRWIDGSDSVGIGRASRIQYATHGPKHREVTLSFRAMTGSDAETADAFVYDVGRSKQFLLCTDTDSPARRTMFARLQETPALSQPFFDGHDVQYVAIESR